VSLPVPPVNLSEPFPPIILSLPAPPSKVSATPAPSKVSLPAVPTLVSALAVPNQLIVSGETPAIFSKSAFVLVAAGIVTSVVAFAVTL